MINLFSPSYNGKAIRKEMKKMFPNDMSNRWLGQGPLVDKFEKEFGEKFGYKYPIAVSSGSAALELAYHLIGIKEGDEVLTPVLTCTATNLPLERLGADIRFIDIKGDLTMSYEDVAKKITEDTKAIVVVTLGGLPVDERIFKLAKNRKIPVVVDAAQSLGVAENRGDYICYSFQAIKHFTTGDGGMLIANNKAGCNRAKKLRWFGIDREAKMKNNWQPYKRREMTMDIEESGYKYQMNDIQALMGLCGLTESDKWLEHRRQIAEYYTENLQCVTFSGGSYWLFGIKVDNRDKVAEFLKENDIETNMAHLRNDIFTVFGGERQDLPNMNNIEPHYLYIPLNLKVTLAKAKEICKIINIIC